MLKRILMAASVAAFAAGCGTTQGTTTASSAGGTTARPTTTNGSATNNASTTGGSTTANGSTSANGSTTEGSTGQSNTGSPTSGTNSTNSTTEGGSSGTTSPTTSTTAGNNSTSTNAGSSGSTGAAACVNDDVPTARAAAPFTEVCLSSVTTLFAISAGGDDGGGTVYNGQYYVSDENGNAMLVFKTKYAPPTGDPVRGHVIDSNGKVELNPRDYTDGGSPPDQTVELSGGFITITDQGVPPGATLPTPKSPTLAQLDYNNPDQTMIGSYVMIPAGTYTLNTNQPIEEYHFDGGYYVDGVSITDGTSTVLIDTYDWGHFALNSTCLPRDGGTPNFATGGFKGVFDYGYAPDGSTRAQVFFGDCSDAASP